MADQRQIYIEDEILLQKWRQGDVAAIEMLVSKYQNRIYNIIFKICANPDDAMELTQDTFVKLLENINTFEGRSSFYTWVFRIAMNLTLNYRKRSRLRFFSSLDVSGQADNEQNGALKAVLLDEKTPDPADIAQNSELCGLVQNAISQLDEEQRTIIILRDVEGMDYLQIAEVLGVELGTVKSRLSRARAALRQILEAFVR